MSGLQTFYDPDNKILYGPEYHPLISENASMGQLLLYMLKREGDKVLQVNDNSGIELTAKDLKLMSIRVAKNLMKNGYQQEDVIGFVAGNSEYLAVVIFAAIYCGLQINSLDPTFAKNEIKHMFGITRPSIIFCDSDVYDKVKETIDDLNLNVEICLINGEINGIPNLIQYLTPTENENTFVVPKLKNGCDQTLAILCSSGSTGFSKGVCLSHKTFIKNVMGNSLESNQIITCFSTMYWISGITCLLLAAVNGYKRIITTEQFSPKLFLDLIEKYQITLILTPPSQMALTIQSPEIDNRNLSCVKQYYCGGSPVPEKISNKMQSYLQNGKVLVGYGMSEIGGIISIENPPLMKKGSAGKVFSSLQVKIINENGQNLGPNETGEICINTGNKWLGYYNDDKSTKSTYINDWIYSGDLGYFDNDGYLYINGRKKEIMKYKSYQFYPTELELIILEIPDIIEVCVFGIPDIIAGDLPAAVIIKKVDSKLCEKEVYKFVKNKVSHYKNLRGGIYFVDEIPKTASGKIQRNKIIDMLLEIYTLGSKKVKC